MKKANNSDFWDSLEKKKSLFGNKDEKEDGGLDKNKDPNASLMEMMRDMYQNGDPEMKKMIAEAWTKSREETEKVTDNAPVIQNLDQFSVYDDIRAKLIERGIPADEIAFIHDANTEIRKKELFAKVRSGQVRVLMGSTAKMGAGMNVQDRLIALHDLDAPWRPGDLEQRAGRIVRQGNKNKEVYIYRYVTEKSFDAYLWVRHDVA